MFMARLKGGGKTQCLLPGGILLVLAHSGLGLHWPPTPPSCPVHSVTLSLSTSVKSFPLNHVCLSQEKNQRKKAWQGIATKTQALVISSGLFVIVEFVKFK